KTLKKIYSYKHFKPRQYEIINRILNGEDVCAILPTGYGKSLTFQLPAIYRGIPIFVISPLISLMEDQKIILDELGIKSCCYNSTVSDKASLQSRILRGKYQIIYITPEAIVRMSNFLIQMEDKIGILMFAIDEAHCISSY